MGIDVLNEKIKNLSLEEREQVIQYIEKIISTKKSPDQKHKLTFNWAGGLESLKDEFTSLELQKKALQLRS